MAISTHIHSDQQYSSEGNCSQNLLQMLFSYLKLNMNPGLIWLPVQCVWEKTLHKKSSGVLSWGLFCLWDEDGFCSQSYSQTRCLEVSCPRLAAGTSGRQKLIRLIMLNPEPGHPLGTLPGLPGMDRGAGNKVSTNRLTMLPALCGNTGLAFSRSKNNPIRKGFSDKMHHWL